ncbi:adenosine receptor A3-like [Clavelina lepadiformis]|uniref:adenosine receptor A3-like n=1 Tax=Clavelina lepadiformis TaxID=159417 RepID=UPI00404148DB
MSSISHEEFNEMTEVDKTNQMRNATRFAGVGKSLQGVGLPSQMTYYEGIALTDEMDLTGMLNTSYVGNTTSFLLNSEENTCSTVGERKVTLAEIIACVISILTVAENVVILIAITRGPRCLRKPPYWFIASLAAADLLTGFEVVLAIFVPVGNSPLSRIVLKGMAVVTFIVSINSLLLVSMDRYLRIAHHVDYDRLLKRRTVIMLILASWLISFGLFLITPLLGWSCAEQYCCAMDGLCVCRRSVYGSSICDTQCSKSFVPFSKLYILTGVVYFVISILVMTGLYAALFKVVKKKSFGHPRTANGSSSGTSKAKKREVQLAKTLIITLGIFVICWLPVMALFVADLIIKSPTTQLAKVFDYALVPSVVNSFLNPIIYSIRLPRMRQTVKQVVLPCLFNGEKTYFGATWATNTSLDRSIRRKSVRKRLEKLKGPSGSSTGSTKSQLITARSRLMSTKSVKSLNSEVSVSVHSSSTAQPASAPKN